MSREVRRIPPTWEHPKDSHGRFIPLLTDYSKRAAEFLRTLKTSGLEAAAEDPGCPVKDQYMPEWSLEEATHWMMYETTTEGTPKSPAFATPEELAHYLADNHVSSFGPCTATYKQWLDMIHDGYAISGVYTRQTGIISGVEATSLKTETPAQP